MKKSLTFYEPNKITHEVKLKPEKSRFDLNKTISTAFYGNKTPTTLRPSDI